MLGRATPFVLAVALAAVGLALGAKPLVAECPPPIHSRSYSNGDGTTTDEYLVPVGTNGEDCTAEAAKALGVHNQGNSAGTRSFELKPTAMVALAESTVKIVDGTSMRMRGLPRIEGGRFIFTNEVGQLVALPLREVAAVDTGGRYRCGRCARDAKGRPVANPAVAAAFVAATPCPATGVAGGECPGHVVAHVTPLACGGEDLPANLHWQTVAEARRTEAWVRTACSG